jgi:hypothetical protein
MQLATSLIVVESITLIILLNREGNPQYLRPIPNSGYTFCSSDNVSQKSYFAMSAERTMFACDNPFLLGAVAPRIVDRAPL